MVEDREERETSYRKDRNKTGMVEDREDRETNYKGRVGMRQA
jgi:hypothetical protein